MSLGVQLTPLDGDLVRLAHHVQDHRQPDPDEHRVLQRDDHGEHERDQEHGFLQVSGLPHRLEVRRLDRAVPDQHQQPGEGGHSDVADHPGEDDDHDRHHHAREHQGLAGTGASRLVER